MSRFDAHWCPECDNCGGKHPGGQFEVCIENLQDDITKLEEEIEDISHKNYELNQALEKSDIERTEQAENIERLKVLLIALKIHGFEQLTDCEQEQIIEIECHLKKGTS